MNITKVKINIRNWFETRQQCDLNSTITAITDSQFDVFLGRGTGSNKKRQGSLYCKLIVENFRKYLDLPVSQKQQFAMQKIIISIEAKGGISQVYNKEKGAWTLGEPKRMCSRVI